MKTFKMYLLSNRRAERDGKRHTCTKAGFNSELILKMLLNSELSDSVNSLSVIFAYHFSTTIYASDARVYMIHVQQFFQLLKDNHVNSLNFIRVLKNFTNEYKISNTIITCQNTFHDQRGSGN